jgi:biopolymer transport protein ExbB
MEERTVFSLLELFRMGGVFMWPLLVFSMAALAIIVDRILFLLRHKLTIEEAAAKVMDSIQKGTLGDAAGFLEPLAGNSMGARVLLAFVHHSGLSEDRLEKAIETEAQGCINALESGFTFLTAIGSLAPLTGFLGTVSGMIGAFRSIAEAAEVNARVVANGIYEALITTVFGLIIAIIAMSAYYILSSFADRFAVRTERCCSELLTALAKARSPADAGPQTGAGSPANAGGQKTNAD